MEINSGNWWCVQCFLDMQMTLNFWRIISSPILTHISHFLQSQRKSVETLQFSTHLHLLSPAQINKWIQTPLKIWYCAFSECLSQGCILHKKLNLTFYPQEICLELFTQESPRQDTGNTSTKWAKKTRKSLVFFSKHVISKL